MCACCRSAPCAAKMIAAGPAQSGAATRTEGAHSKQQRGPRGGAHLAPRRAVGRGHDRRERGQEPRLAPAPQQPLGRRPRLVSGHAGQQPRRDVLLRRAAPLEEPQGSVGVCCFAHLVSGCLAG